MFGQKKAHRPDFITTATQRSAVIPVTDSRHGLDFLVGFFGSIRPAPRKRNAAQNLQRVTGLLQEHPVLLSNLQNALLSQLVKTDLGPAITESGIPPARGFWQEFFGRLRHKLLPPLQSENDFLYVLNRVFFRSRDYQWVESIPREAWVRFFENVGLSFHVDDARIVAQLLQSAHILSYQIAQLGFEKEVWGELSAGQQMESPFTAINALVHELGAWVQREETRGQPARDLSGRFAKVLAQCHACIAHIRENHPARGASLHQTYILILLANRLDRLSILVDLLDNDHQMDTGKFVDFFRLLVRNENRKNSIREFMSQSLGYLAYQIAEHKGSKGNKYITSSRAEYRDMLKSAMGGGAWVCLAVIIKNLLTKLDMPLFWHGFAYSVNYSVAFVVIEETHTTLATKQPAFTASAVAVSLDTRKQAHEPNLYNLAVTVAKVARSQIASFAGNLLVVFPGAWLLAWAYDMITHAKLVKGAAALDLLREQHPWQSLSLFYACITGFFLFLSGILAGYVQNKMHYSHIPERLQTHPILRLSLPPEKLRRLAAYVERHAGTIIGNIALGFFLGMAGSIGKIFGIPLDVRHITISAGNTAVAVYGLGFAHISRWYLLTVVMGVLAIGFLNFAVSFSLAFFVAVRSRGIRLKDYPGFIGILWRYFRKSPLDFLRPRKRVHEPENTLEKSIFP